MAKALLPSRWEIRQSQVKVGAVTAMASYAHWPRIIGYGKTPNGAIKDWTKRYRRMVRKGGEA